MREWMGYLFAVALFAYHSVADIRTQRIPAGSLGIGVVISVCWAMGKVLLGERTQAAVILGLLPGIAVLLLAKATREQVGSGDGWELVIMGSLLGWTDCLLGLGIALLGAFAASVILLACRKARGSTRIPFVPFLCMGTVAVTVLRLGK